MSIRSLRRSRPTNKSKQRLEIAGGLMITSMLDILVTILFFLLKNYSYVITNFAVSNDLSLPVSTAFNPPPDASLQLVVTRKSILLDDRELIRLTKNGYIPRRELHSDGVTIVKLFQALEAHKKRSKYFQNRSDKHSFTGTVVLQADKGLPFRLLKKVIYTAGVTDFVNLRLAVIKEK